MHGVYVKTNRYQDNVVTYAKKLIEVSLPLDAINTESAREKSIRHGHPSTLHLWWARRPLATARAVLWASLVDDPSSHPELFPTEEDQIRERKRLHGLLAELVKWENSGNETLLFAANFSDKEAQMELTIPDHAFEWMELPVTPMLNPETRIRMNIPPMDAVMFTLSEPGEPAV